MLIVFTIVWLLFRTIQQGIDRDARSFIVRNHSTQYCSYPKFDFAQLRQESPEKYESYIDLEPGDWTKYRITVKGTKAFRSTAPVSLVWS